MTQAPMPQMPPMPGPPSRAPGPGLVVSLVVMGLGIAIGIASAIAIIVPLVGTFTSSEYSAPGDFPVRLHLRHARYTVYERTGSQSALGGFDFGDRSGVTIGPAQVTVVAPDGSRVPVFVDPDNETQTRGSTKYTGAVAFDAPTGGVYTVRVSPERATTVLIARSLGDAVRSVLVWFGTGAIGFLIAVGGLVMLIVGVTRRGRAKRAAMYPGWGPPGQYPPYGPPPGPYPPYGSPPGPWQQPPGQYPPSGPPPGPPPNL